MSEHLTSPSQILANASHENRYKANETFGLLDGPDAEKAAYAAKPFMDVAVDLHEFIAAPDNESYGTEDNLGLSELVGYAEQKARAAVNDSTEINEQETLVLQGYRADLRARKASLAAEAATDLFDISGNSPDERSKAFTLLTERRLENIVRSAEGEERSKYFRIQESLKARCSLVDADEEDRAVFSRKYNADDTHIYAMSDLASEGIVSREHHTDLLKDIRKNNQNTETDQYLTACYRLFTAQEKKTSAQHASTEKREQGHSVSNTEPVRTGMTGEEFAAARDMVAGMNSKKVAEHTSVVPNNPKERQSFEREYFSAVEHTIPNQENIQILGELVASYAESLATTVRDLQNDRSDVGVRYAGNLRTFWFTADTLTESNPKDGKDKLLFDYLKRELKQPDMNYANMIGLPMDKVAKLMGVDLRSKISDYDSLFSTPVRKPQHQPIYNILDAQ